MHELPLLIFTLFVQGSVGLSFFIMLSARAQNAVNREKGALIPSMLVACVVGGLGLVASTLHLGYPLNAFNALRHVASSWLSREIVFASLYLAALGLCTLVALVKKQLWRVLLPVATLLGLIDVYCMGAIYVHTSVVTWQHINTWFMFYGTVGILGAVAMVWLLAWRLSSARMQTLAKMAAVLVIAVTVARLLVQPDYIGYLGGAGMSEIVTLPHHPLEAFHEFSDLRLATWTLSVIGTLLFSIGAWRTRRAVMVAGSLLLVVSEVLFRFMFFSIH